MINFVLQTSYYNWQTLFSLSWESCSTTESKYGSFFYKFSLVNWQHWFIYIMGFFLITAMDQVTFTNFSLYFPSKWVNYFFSNSLNHWNFPWNKLEIVFIYLFITYSLYISYFSLCANLWYTIWCVKHGVCNSIITTSKQNEKKARR